MMTEARSVIPIAELCGPHCTTPDEAQKLHDRLVQILRTKSIAEMDFQGVQTILSLFLNLSVGRLYGAFDEAFVDSHVTWRGLDQSDESLLRLVTKNAKAHYKASPSDRARESEIVRRSIGNEP